MTERSIAGEHDDVRPQALMAGPRRHGRRDPSGWTARLVVALALTCGASGAFAAGVGSGKAGPAKRPLATVGAAAEVSAAAQARQLMDWAERHPQYGPRYFPNAEATQSLPPFLFRHYPRTGVYLGVASGNDPTYPDGVYVMGGEFGAAPVFVGPVTQIITPLQPGTTRASGQARLTLGNGHALAVRADGNVLAWGLNNAGQLGDGPAIAGSNARLVALSATAVAAGGFESLALDNRGIVRGWGRKFATSTIVGGSATFGGTVVPSPVAAALPDGVTHLVTGTANGFAFVRRTDGTVWHLPGAATAIPGGLTQAAQPVPGLTGVAALGGGSGSTGEAMAIRNDGTVWRIDLTPVGVGAWQATALRVTGLSGVVATACNGLACIALTESGTVVGFPSVGDAWPTPVEGLPTVKQIAATGTSFVALTADGRVWQWLEGGTPAAVGGIAAVAEVAAGLQTVLARLDDGSVWGWGSNNFGELGASTGASAVPVRVPGINLN